jgi:hypothetical protein
MKKYVEERMNQPEEYANYQKAEIDEFATRLDTLWVMIHKGVHEDWVQGALRPLVLRLILLLNDLLIPVKPAAQQFSVRPDDLFG